jgi:hypothetical protein
MVIRPDADDADEMVQAEVVCFCDIPADDLGLHMTKYGPFGISFPKPFLRQHGANPVYYVARDARAVLSRDSRHETLGGLFPAGIRRFLDRNPHFASGDRDDAWRDAVAFHTFVRINVLAFVKPFAIADAAGKPVSDTEPANVYMEREWRALGPVHFGMLDVSRITLPREYAARLRSDCPSYCAQLTFADPHDLQ